MNSQDSIKEQKRMGLGMMILAWMVFLGLGILFFGDVLEKQFNPNQRLDTQYSKAGMREVVLQRQPVTFMLDTGATGVAIPEAIARKLDIPRGRPYRTQTANGISTSYAASLDSVAVGEIELRDVQAGIAPGLAMNQILLGMTFLKHIEFTQRGDTLILRQYL
jgi:aspartyl protease family protein